MKITRTNRKTISLRINPQGELEVRAPLTCTDSEIQKVVQRHQEWIAKQQAAHKTYTETEIAILRSRARTYIPARVAYYAILMNVKPASVKITSARSRYGSCSSKKRLCFSLYLMDNSPRAIDYVVVHELAHLRHMNHSPAFYREVERILPDYREREKELRP
ncbi:MAG: M48 family metallopeptidase [Clostridia bacterium]|nr:M48 family metallopeptidase [Clostridia bacterium]